MAGKVKRVVAISDLHCGHMAGLTPPGYQISAARSKTVRAVQSEMWRFYSKTMAALQPINALLCLGDCIDGKGSRNGGTEHLTLDLKEQCAMAVGAISEARAGKVVMVHGTPYHVGPEGEAYERLIADEVGGTIGGHEWAECHGVVFDLKHKIGSSQIPHGRHTAIAREKLWNYLWAQRGMAVNADILLRGHVHYYGGAFGAGWIGFTLPALQGPGSKYGVEQCSGEVHFGLLSFDIYPDGRYTWQPHLVEVKAARPVPVRL